MYCRSKSHFSHISKEVKKRPSEPSFYHFGEVFGTKIALRSTKFILETDSKTLSIFNIHFKSLLLGLGAKMAPRWHQNDAKMTPRCCPKSKIVPGRPQDLSRPRFSSILDPPRQYFSIDFGIFFVLQTFIKSYNELAKHLNVM